MEEKKETSPLVSLPPFPYPWPQGKLESQGSWNASLPHWHVTTWGTDVMVSLRTQLLSPGSWASHPGERTGLEGECIILSVLEMRTLKQRPGEVHCQVMGT
jgi:hypothetical protein